jgi:hypothetical protein
MIDALENTFRFLSVREKGFINILPTIIIMAGDWRFLTVFLLALVFFNLAFAGAEALEVTILPDNKIVSVNSNIVVKVDPETSTAPVRLTWSVYNTGAIGLGSFPIVGGMGVCYFSNTDGNATCGPSPFFQTGETELYVSLITPGTTTNALNVTIPINVSSLTIPISGVVRQDNSVYMNIYMGEMGLMKYSIYKEDLSIYQSERPLAYNGVHGKYEGNITLNPGVYYFTFVGANGTSTFGSALKRIEIPSSDFLTLQTDKKDYWKGGRIRISGSASKDVAGEVRFPNGSKALGFNAIVIGDGSFYYDFYSAGGWPEGTYGIITSQPLAKTANFTVADFLELTPSSVSGSVDEGDDFTASLTLKNIRQNATNVTLSFSGDVIDSYVTIGNRSLDPQQSTTISVSIPNVLSSVDGTITLSTPEGIEIAVPVKVSVTGSPGECPVCGGGGGLEIESETAVWSQECLAGEQIFHSVTISNNGDSALSDFSYDTNDSPGSGQSLVDLDMGGSVDVPLSGVSVGPGDSQEIDISITPSDAGNYEGTITLISGSEKAHVLVSLKCFEDASLQLSALSDRLKAANPSAAVSGEINSDIDNAQTAVSLGNYAQANEYVLRAQAKLDLLETGGGPAAPAPDMTWIIIIIVIIIAVLAFLWFFMLRKPKSADGATEEEIGELESFG